MPEDTITTLPKTKLSQQVFTSMLEAMPELVENGEVKRDGRQEFMTRMNVALAAQGDTMTEPGLSNYYARNKAAYEKGSNFYQHNKTPKQRKADNDAKTRIAALPEGAVAEADADHTWRARNTDAGAEYYFATRSKADKYKKANTGFKVGQVKLEAQT